MVPADVEKRVEFRSGAVFEHIRQHAVVGVEGHVVGNDILQPAEALFPQPVAQGIPVALGSQLGIQDPGIDAVVAMPASLAGGENRRSVNVGDAQLREIADDVGRLGKTEFRLELQPVGGVGNVHGRRPAFRWCVRKINPFAMPAASRPPILTACLPFAFPSSHLPPLPSFQSSSTIQRLQSRTFHQPGSVFSFLAVVTPPGSSRFPPTAETTPPTCGRRGRRCRLSP